MAFTEYSRLTMAEIVASAPEPAPVRTLRRCRVEGCPTQTTRWLCPYCATRVTLRSRVRGPLYFLGL